jgi:NhaC family Na+:H+ antiporter
MAGTLGVSTLEYAPYYFFGFLSPLILLVMGVTGWQIFYKEQGGADEASPPASDGNPAAPDED